MIGLAFVTQLALNYSSLKNKISYSYIIAYTVLRRFIEIDSV